MKKLGKNITYEVNDKCEFDIEMINEIPRNFQKILNETDDELYFETSTMVCEEIENQLIVDILYPTIPDF
jgi:hypothetical protein